MGVYYIVVPLDSEMLDYAREQGVPVQRINDTGCRATLDQLLEIAKSIPGYSFKTNCHREGFQITIDSKKRVTCRSASGLHLIEVPADHLLISGSVDPAGVITRMSCRGSADLLVTVVRGLTKTCGPQMFFANWDAVPWLVLSYDAVPLGPEPLPRNSGDVAQADPSEK